MQDEKQQLELDVEQQICSKSGKKYIKAVPQPVMLKKQKLNGSMNSYKTF